MMQSPNVLFFSIDLTCLFVCVCVAYRNTLHLSVSLRSVCLRTTTSPTRPSCTDRPSQGGLGTSASTGTAKS